MDTQGPRRPSTRAAGRTLWRLLAAGVAVGLAVTGVGRQPAVAAKPTPVKLGAQQIESVHGRTVQGRDRPEDMSQQADGKPARQVVWPSGSATADLASAAVSAEMARATGGPPTRAPAGPVRAGGLPVWVAPAPAAKTNSAAAGTPGSVQVRVLDRAGLPEGWRKGVVLRLTSAASRAGVPASGGPVQVSVGYGGFATAFGADWPARLRLLAVPECALTTPGRPGCSARPIVADNNVQTQRVTGTVTLPSTDSADAVTARQGVLVALVAGGSGNSGDYAASPVSGSSSWAAGGNSGDFSWSYPMRTPPGLGGPEPKVILAYSSSSVDGRSATTNNQPSWLGEGFDYQPGFISRSYKPCSDDRSGGNQTQKTADECWGTDNAVMTFNGKSSELVKDGTTGTWRLKDDDNSRVEHLTDTVNKDNDHEYWRVTTDDGTQYYFGRNRLPGYTGTAPANRETRSVWTVPVAGNQSGEPCHASGFTASFCQQAWRWNLDYVVDLHGNTMSVWYNTPESNHYARNLTDSDVVSYDRGGTINHIEYGTDNRSGTDTAYTSTKAASRVNFAVSDRCASNCSTHDVTHWPDTPWDQSCTSSTSCPGLYGPTFWTTKRLTNVTTQVWDAATSAYKDVDSWTLTQNWPPSGDGTRDGMWLESITHTGKATGPNLVGSSISLPSVNFDWTQMANRVATPDDHDYPMNWMRLSTIWTDTGGKIDIRYTDPDCIPGSRMPSSPQSNTLRCYPVLEKQPDGSTKTEYFNKYLVTEVVQADYTGHNPSEPPSGADDGSPDVVTTYEYVGAPAWRHADDDGMTKDSLRTWSDFRGYRRVNTRVGDIGQGQQTLTETVYFQGMDGDLNGSGGTRSVSLPAVDVNADGDTSDAADAPAVVDADAFAGMARQTTVFNGVESAPVSTTVSRPWQSVPTASRDMGQTTVHARRTGTQTSWAATKLSAGGWRVARSDTTFDGYGMPNVVDDQGDVSTPSDDQCTKKTYLRNTGANLLTTVEETDVYALRCSASPASVADVVSMSRDSFDGQPFGSAPTKGDITKTEVAKAWSGGTATWLTDSTAGHDAYGRATDMTDVRGNHTTTAYTPSSGGPVTQVATTTPLGTTTNTLEPSWGTTVATADVNNHRTEATFDALGRTRQVWNPNHLKAAYPTQPNTTYTYLVRASGGDSAVTTKMLNANGIYVTSYSLYDGLTRLRQTQTASAANGNVGTVFTHVKYDPAGRQVRQMKVFDSSVQPSATLYSFADWQAHTQTVTRYDRASRVVARIQMDNATELWRTTTSYGGDRTSVTPPAGGTATTMVTDAQGRTVQLRQYHTPSDVGSDNRSLYDLVTYRYNKKGQRDQVIDNAGNTWTYAYDLLGRQIAQHDPDQGDSTSAYNDYGDLTSTTDGRGQTLAYVYDPLGRKLEEHSGTTSGPKLASWTYDPPGGKGQVATATRWVDGAAYTVTTLAYNTLGKPSAVRYSIPASQTGLSGTYTYSYGYKVDGSPSTVSMPNVGGLGAETVSYTYQDTTGLPEQLRTSAPGVSQYVANTDYTAYGELSFVQYQMAAGNFLQRQYRYDDATRRLAQVTTARQVAPQIIDDTRYSYDAAGNITKIAESSALAADDSQCYRYDYARRLSSSWTPGDGDCGADPSVAGLGGPAPYWQSWTFDAVGDRLTQTVHTIAGDTTSTSAYPAAGGTRPHAVASITTSGPGGSDTADYSYDDTGNTTSRPSPAGQQTLSWDAEGHLSGVAGGADDSYVYDADGNRLVAATATATTLYLPLQEVTRTKSTGTVTATRYYTWAGQTVASIATGQLLQWLVTDGQGTALMAVQAGNQTTVVRRQDPYGNPRGQTPPSWPNPHGYVGGLQDATGLTHLGARDYDPTAGRFISVDPIFNQDDPQSWTGYAYANNTPVTSSDPSGLTRCDVGACPTPAQAVSGPNFTATHHEDDSCGCWKYNGRSEDDPEINPYSGAHGGTYNPKAYHSFHKFLTGNKAYAQSLEDNLNAQRAAISAENLRELNRLNAQLAKERAAHSCHGFWCHVKNTVHRAAGVLSTVSMAASLLGSFAGFVPGMQGISAGLFAISTTTGLLSAGLYAASGDFTAAGVSLLGTAAGAGLTGAGRIAPRLGKVAAIFNNTAGRVTGAAGKLSRMGSEARTFVGITGNVRTAWAQRAWITVGNIDVHVLGNWYSVSHS